MYAPLLRQKACTKTPALSCDEPSAFRAHPCTTIEVDVSEQDFTVFCVSFGEALTFRNSLAERFPRRRMVQPEEHDDLCDSVGNRSIDHDVVSFQLLRAV